MQLVALDSVVYMLCTRCICQMDLYWKFLNECCLKLIYVFITAVRDSIIVYLMTQNTKSCRGDLVTFHK